MKRLLLAIAAACPLGAQSSAPAWTLSARPTLDIGSEANTQTQFDGVTGILRMPGGEIVVANGTSQELRVFSASGEYLRTLTASGRTVYMRALDRIWRGAGDTIYAAEVLAAESNILSFTTKAFVAKTQIGSSNAGGVYPIDRLPDGHFVVSAAPRRQNQSLSGLSYIEVLPLGVMSPASRIPEWFGSLRNEMLQIPNMGRGRGGGRVVVPYPFGRSTHVAVSGGRIWVGDSETGTITLHDATGKGVAVFAAPTRERALDTAAIQRARRSQRSDAMNWNDRERIVASYSVPFPPKAPRFARLLPGTAGEMWVELFREDQASPRAYVVVNRSGSPIGRVSMPARFTPLEVGAGDVMGVLTDDEGLEHVVRYTLSRR